jgi:hypothetical protein
MKTINSTTYVGQLIKQVPTVTQPSHTTRFGHDTANMATEGLTMGLGMAVGMRVLDWLGTVINRVAKPFKGQ